jgi:hypothetical protein
MLGKTIAPPYLKTETQKEPLVLWSRNLDKPVENKE